MRISSLALGVFRISLFCSIAVAACSKPAAAADKTGQFAIKGGGLQSCQKFNEAVSNKTADVSAYAGWIEGYLTGQNQRLPGVFDVTPWQTTQTMLGAMASYCSSLPPDTRFIDAFDGLLRIMLPSHLSESSQIKSLRVRERTFTVYESTVVMVHNRLRELGFDIPSDAAPWGTVVEDAVISFQKENGLKPTGLPDQQTLMQLLVTSNNG